MSTTVTDHDLMVHGLLLRAPQGHPDRYESALASVDVIPLSIPVLETVLVNQTELRCIVENGPQKSDVDGVIITSARACEAWGAAVRSLGGSHPNVGKQAYLKPCWFTSFRPTHNIGWHDVPFYVVGTGTAESLSTIATHNRESPHIPHDIRGGVESGTGERLAQFIVQDASRVPTDRQGGGHRYLFLTGDKNRETLPLILSAGGISLDSLMVYETRGSSTFSANLSTSLSSVQQDKGRNCCLW